MATEKPSTTTPSAPKPRRKPGVVGHPPFQPTAEQRQLVLALTGYGIPQEDIATLVKNPRTGDGISPMTLRKYFEREIKDGMATANSKVVGALFKNATTGTNSFPGGVPIAQIFWLKCRAGWQRKEGDAPPPPPLEERGRLEIVRRIAFALTQARRPPPKLIV